MSDTYSCIVRSSSLHLLNAFNLSKFYCVLVTVTHTHSAYVYVYMSARVYECHFSLAKLAKHDGQSEESCSFLQ